jgi:AbrB family looped-hinge helix DNA binding protein
MTYRVGPKGQVVIPKPIRDSLGIAPGDEVEVDERGGEIVIRAATRPPLRGMLAHAGTSLTDGLLQDRKAERERERRATGR